MKEHGFHSYKANIGDRWFFFQGNVSDICAWCHPTAIAKDFFYLKSLDLTVKGSNGHLVARENDIIMISDIRVDYNTKMWSNLEELLAGGLTHRQIIEFLEL
jgi:hypothetical protein